MSILENYLTNETHTQLLLFIHGRPGVRKTWTINEFKKKLENLHKKFLCTAYTGAAASLLVGGETIHSLFQIPVGNSTETITQSSLSDTDLRHLHDKFSKCNYIIIDEVSTVGSLMLYIINSRLQEVMGNNDPFGGINILLLGDFRSVIVKGYALLAFSTATSASSPPVSSW